VPPHPPGGQHVGPMTRYPEDLARALVERGLTVARDAPSEERITRILDYAEAIERVTQPGYAQTCAQHIQTEVRAYLAASRQAEPKEGV